MKKKRYVVYVILNIAFLLGALGIFGEKYFGMSFDWRLIWRFLLLVLVVYSIKALRLYFLFLGQGMSLMQFLKQYCKVIPVSILLPYKTGEIFRIYCYGYQLRNYVAALEVVILDRFVDTIALIVVATVVTWILGGTLTGIIYFLLFFLLLMLVVYLVFPEIYRYWKHFFLLRPATKKGLRMLDIMDRTNKAYCGLARIANGKMVILLILSVLAWTIEIGGIFLLNGTVGGTSVVLDYLSAALTGQSNENLQMFVLASVILMLVVYVILHFGMRIAERKDKKC